MNIFSIDTQTSKYINVEHPVISIDGIPLDLYLHNLYPDNLYLGLIPTITDWIGLKEEAELVLRRFISEEEIIILPILMCPDDCDLTCTLIVAEVLKSDDQVIWRRIGVDSSNLGIPYNYELVGKEVT
ncbi:hypothetical protein [Paenibacillus silvae]|uniref:hypothetical protein n=1 Tax=Paenibacillus silvae TaxID=1325358 RepID=UPI0020053FEA|nr:hypothetical protein [Paenibacillus silvae]MCK6073914.1 hypothetical protein [Paenibacillus silvae]MCK6148609.1 hypothetical protein [Paenibacillus silvae]MCK6266910.1 hypothetical protein [Paenibacillus silvae]